MSINVTRSSMPPFEEYCDEIRGLWDSRWLTNMGCKHRQLEEDLQRYLQCGQITLFTNGHLALENILQAFRLPVHVYGNLCDTDRIGEIGRKYGLPVIYDAAHSFGVFRNGVSSACFGDAAMFSFHATKVFHTIEGGAVCCHSEEIRRRLCDLKNFGIHDEENVPYVGGNAKMNEFCAAMGICNLRHLEEEIEKRRLVREHYDGRLGGTPRPIGRWPERRQMNEVKNYK